MKPFFSIIIPTLNEEYFLPKLLTDLEKQKEKNFEIIIIDGNSQDQTETTALNFSKKLPIVFLTTTKRNVAFQRNCGARKANGTYFLFLDADSGVNRLFTNRLATIIKREKGLIFIPYIVPEEKYPEAKPIFDFANFLVELSQNLNKPLSSGGSMIVENNFFNLMGGFDESLFLSEDHDLVRKAYLWGVRAKVLSQIKVRFSLRRMKKEGQLKVMYKYLLATAYSFLKGDIKKKIFEYQMGGSHYKNGKTDINFLSRRIKTNIYKVKKVFGKIFS